MKFGWEDVVTVCRDMQNGCTLGDEDTKSKSVSSQPPQPPTFYNNHLPTTGTGPTKTGAGEKKGCGLCKQLGGGGDNHSREWCYIDPKSKAYKPEVR